MSIPGRPPSVELSGYHRRTVHEDRPSGTTTGRFPGAITGPHDGGPPRDASIVPAPARPPRPPLIELGAAILVVGGLISILGTLGTLEAATETLDIVFIGLGALTIVVGLLVRAGRAWILAINVVAVVLFLEVTALPSAVAIFFAALDTIVLIALIRHRAWFERETWIAPSQRVTPR
jgi:hypothetical protein